MIFRDSIDIRRSFVYALILSLIFHILLFLNWPFYRKIFSSHNDRIKKIEVTYLKYRDPTHEKSEDVIKVQRSVVSPQPSTPLKMVSKPSAQAEKMSKSSKELSNDERRRTKDEELIPQKKTAPAQKSLEADKKQPAGMTKTTLSAEASDLRLVPASYSQLVRNKIINNLDTGDSDSEGDVFVRFVITSGGGLKDISIVNEKSSKNGFLRTMAFEAVKNSSPFPLFPKDVALSEITFTCEISFLRR